MDDKNNESAPRTSQTGRRSHMRNRLAMAGLSLALLGGGAAITVQPLHAATAVPTAKVVVETTKAPVGPIVSRVGWGG